MISGIIQAFWLDLYFMGGCFVPLKASEMPGFPDNEKGQMPSASHIRSKKHRHSLFASLVPDTEVTSQNDGFVWQGFEGKYSLICVEYHWWIVTSNVLMDLSMLPTFDLFFIHRCLLSACFSQDTLVPLFEVGKPALQCLGFDVDFLCKFSAWAHISGPLSSSYAPQECVIRFRSVPSTSRWAVVQRLFLFLWNPSAL